MFVTKSGRPISYYGREYTSDMQRKMVLLIQNTFRDIL